MNEIRYRWGESYLDEIEQKLSDMELITTTGAMQDGWLLGESVYAPTTGTFKIPKRRIIYFQSSDPDIIRRLLCTSGRLQRMIAMLPSFGCYVDEETGLCTDEQYENRRRFMKKAEENKAYDFLYRPGQMMDYILPFEQVYEQVNPYQCAAVPCYTIVNCHEYCSDQKSMELARMLRVFSTNRCFENSMLLLSSPEEHIPVGYEDKIELIRVALPRRADIERHLLRRMRIRKELSHEQRMRLGEEAQRFRGLSFSQIDDVMSRVEGEAGFCGETQAPDSKTRKTCAEIERREIKSIREEMARKDPTISIVDCGDAGSIACPPGYAQWIHLRLESFKNRLYAVASGEGDLKGVIVAGVPGTGKTMLARYTARLLGVPLVELQKEAIKDMYVGSSQKKLAAFLRRVEELSPAVLLIDEIEKVFQKSSNENSTDTEMRAQLLRWMQGKDASVFCYFAANDVSQLPPELVRKGRISEHFFAFLPTAKELVNILHVQLCGKYQKALAAVQDGDDNGALLDAKFGRMLLEGKGGEAKKQHKEMDVKEKLLEMINSISPVEKGEETIEAWKRKPLFFTGVDMTQLLDDTFVYLNNSISFRRKPFRGNKAGRGEGDRAYSFEEFRDAFLNRARNQTPQGCSNLDGIARGWMLMRARGYQDVMLAEDDLPMPEGVMQEKAQPVLSFDKYNIEYRPEYIRNLRDGKKKDQDSKEEENQDDKLFLLAANDWRAAEKLPKAGSARHYDYCMYRVITEKMKELIDSGEA